MRISLPKFSFELRSSEQILNLLLSVAQNDERIRACLLNGSRVNKKIIPDVFQDYDVIFIVKDLDSFRKNPDWVDIFGERIILQMPNSMTIDEIDLNHLKDEITYLMLFKDLNKIDLTLVNSMNINSYQDSLTKVLLDKDLLFEKDINPSDRDYWIQPPTQKEFSDSCNEFWWVSTYVVKGLFRKEPIYSKSMIDGPVRKMFMRMIGWYAGSLHNFQINLGAQYRFLQHYIDKNMWNNILATYSNAQIIEIWRCLIQMTTLFHELATILSQELDLHYNLEEAKNVQSYIRLMEERIFQ